MHLGEFGRYDAVGLARLVSDGQVTARELGKLTLEAVALVDKDINAVVETYDERLVNGFADKLPDGPFRGVPILNKDLLVGEAGCLEESGSPLAQGNRPAEDSPLWSRFKKAGFFSLGRTTTAEFGVLGVTENKATGITRNPWDTSRTPGGSSGGSAAIVATGAVPVASGGDGGGSIRVPAAYCGIVGLKPTRGRISLGLAKTDSHVGISTPFALTRSIRDCAYLLDCISGNHDSDLFRSAMPGGPFQHSLEESCAPLRIAYLTESWYGYDTEERVRSSILKTVDFLRLEGHDLAEVDISLNYQEFLDAALNIWSAGLIVGLKALSERFSRPISPETVMNSTYRMFRHGCQLSAEDYIRSLSVFRKLAGEIGRLFENVDLLVLPTTPRVAPPVGYYDINADDSLDLRDWHNSIYANDSFAGVFNVSGDPAISLPIYDMDEKPGQIPVGVQIVAGFGREDLLLKIARQLETAFPWAEKTPQIHVSRM